MAFAARFKGTCRKCSKPVLVGQLISWARKGDSKGEVYHVSCDCPDAKIDLTTSYEREDKLAAGITPAMDELAMLKAKLAELEHTTRVPSTETITPKPSKEALAVTPVLSKSKSNKLSKTSEWYEVFAGVLPYTDRILLIGPPSSGKSTTAMLTANIKHRITMTETTSREDLIGMFHLIDSETKWVDGPITCAMRNGQPVLIDEIDRYSPECASLLYSIIDDKPHISLPSGELVSAQTGYKVIMTSNEGLDTLPPAVQDRIEVIIMAQTPHKAAVADLPTAQSAVEMRYYLALPVPTIQLKPSVRRMRAFHCLVNNDIPSEIAAKLVFGEQGGPEMLSVITSSEGTTPMPKLSTTVLEWIKSGNTLNAIKQYRYECGCELAVAKQAIESYQRGY